MGTSQNGGNGRSIRQAHLAMVMVVEMKVKTEKLEMKEWVAFWWKNGKCMWEGVIVWGKGKITSEMQLVVDSKVDGVQ